MNRVTETAALRQRRRTTFIKKAKSGNPALVVVFILLFVVAVVLAGQYRSAGYADMMRAHFHIPPEVAFAEVRYPRRGSANHIEGIVEFTEAQFETYRAQLSDPDTWKPLRLELHRAEVEGPFSPAALEWHELPKPIFAGTRRVRWGNLSRRLVGDIKVGRALCIAYRRAPGKRKSDWWRKAPKGYEVRFPLNTPAHLGKYNAINCAEMGRSENPLAYKLGLLDFETRSLHMIIR